ncbi:MAG: hypothetical protein WEF86_08825 [Gemmatimonadota bacterium]
MTVPIQIPWDLYLGRVVVWCECLSAGVRRAVLLPRLDTIFGPLEEDPSRELPREALEWRLISPTESDWTQYRALVAKQAERTGVRVSIQRVENVARWMGGRQAAVPQFHLWLYLDDDVGTAIEALYDETEPERRREQWQWLLSWTAPAHDAGQGIGRP